MIGESPTRTDGAAKVTGRAQYVDDIPFGPNLPPQGRLAAAYL